MKIPDEILKQFPIDDQPQRFKIDTSGLSVFISLDSKGRRGKNVTVVNNLPRDKEFLKTLLKHIKKKCGVGGTIKLSDQSGFLEVQGNQVSSIQRILNELDIQCQVKDK